MRNVRNVNADLNGLDKKDLDNLYSAGFNPQGEERVGTFLQSDEKVLFARSFTKGIEVLSINEALEKYPWAKNYYGRAFKKLERDYPSDTQGGYFIWIKKNTTTIFPIQTCLFLKKSHFSQRVHNLIIVEENAKVYLITGCTSSHFSQESSHLGISEFFLKKGAYLNFTMIHSWKEDVNVKPLSIALIEEEAVFLSNYICLKPVRKVVMYPTAFLIGRKARARFNSLLLAYSNSHQDIGSRIIFKAEDTSGEIVSRAVSLGGEIIVRGHLKAESEKIKAHLECRGLIISKGGFIHAIPELESKWKDVDLSHEAAIGKISKEEIEYLASRGMRQEEAQSVIVRGFMDTQILALPPQLKEEINQLTDKTLKEGL